MALQLKGIAGKALQARANVERLNKAYDTFNEAAPAHASDVEGLAKQVNGMQDDLDFAVNTLGNSAGVSDDTKEKENETER